MFYEDLVKIAKGEAPDYGDRNSSTRTWLIEPANPYTDPLERGVLVRQRINFVLYRVRKVYGTRENPGLKWEYLGRVWEFENNTHLAFARKWSQENL